MNTQRSVRSMIGIPFLLTALLFAAACSTKFEDIPRIESVELDPNRQAFAMREVRALQSKGARVWCVPYARNVSGIQIRGNAYTWWAKAKENYRRGNEPSVGAVMVFSKTRRNRNGHLAVVSEVISDREILVDHANWKRNRVSLRMLAKDVSDAGDWSVVRLESQPGSFGSRYPISGFIYPETQTAALN